MKAKIIFTVILLTAITAGPAAMAQGRKDPGLRNDKINPDPRKEESRTRYSQPVDRNHNRNMEVYRQPAEIREKRESHEGYQTLRHSGKDYFYNGMGFHIFSNGRYIPVVPPAGLRVSVLPANHVRIVLGRDVYFYHAGIFFSPHRYGFVIVEPPVGAVVYDLPPDAYRVKIRGRIYYEWHGALFRRIHTKFGPAFIVTGTRHML